MINIEVRGGELFRGDTATLLVELFRRCVQPQKRIVACVAPGAPADFADAVAEVLAPDDDTSLASEPGYAECREFAV